LHLPTPFGISPNWVLLVLATPIVWWGGWIFHSGAWRALRNRTLDMNVLVSLGVLVPSFAWHPRKLMSSGPLER